MSNGSSPTKQTAVREGRDDAERRTLDEYIAMRREDLGEIARFPVKDDDEMSDALCAGEFQVAVFARLDALLETIWNGHGRLDEWTRAGVRIELAERPPDAGEVVPSWRQFVSETYAAHRKWRTVRDRRQIWAGLVLSAVAMAAVAALLFAVAGRCP